MTSEEHVPASAHDGDAASATANRFARAPLLFAAVAVLALVGLADAIYLTVLHLSGETARCTVLTGCSEVLGSRYATIGDVPVAALGAIAYFTVFSLGVLAAFGYRFAEKLLVPLVALMCVVSFLLVGLQAFVLRAFCEFCMLSAAVTFTLAALVAFAHRASRKSRS